MILNQTPPFPFETPQDAGAQSTPREQRWTLDDIPWQKIEHREVAAREDFSLLVAAASLVEATTGLYTRNLIDLFHGDEEVSLWLGEHWLPEELQHGRALRLYVETAWPDFAWEEIYRRFLEEYAPFCRLDALEAALSLEMASRCVVEMGTASYYTTLSRASTEPVLSLLARRIAEDEVRHYKHFYRYFRKYREAEQPGRKEVAGALWRRLRMTNSEDGYIALKHVSLARHPDRPFDKRRYRALRRELRRSFLAQFPHAMSVKMLLKPLELPARAQRVAEPLALAIARRLAP